MTSVKGDDNDEEEVVGSGNEEGEGDGEGERAMGKEVSTWCPPESYITANVDDHTAPAAPQPRPVRSREQLLVELKYRMESEDSLRNDVERCISLPTETLQYCKSELEEAVLTKSANVKELRALRRAVKKATLNLAKAHNRELPEARAAVADNADRIVALQALLSV